MSLIEDTLPQPQHSVNIARLTDSDADQDLVDGILTANLSLVIDALDAGADANYLYQSPQNSTIGRRNFTMIGLVYYDLPHSADPYPYYEALLQNSADPDAPVAPDMSVKHTPVQAVIDGHCNTTIIELFLDYNADVTDTDTLYGAVRNCPLAVPPLLEHGAPVNGNVEFYNIWGGYSNTTLLALAGMLSAEGNRYLTAISAFLENGAVATTTMDGDVNALMLTSCFGSPGAVELLLGDSAVQATINYQSEEGNTALSYATEYGRPENMQLLIDSGASMEVLPKDGLTLFEHALTGPNSSKTLMVLLNHTVALLKDKAATSGTTIVIEAVRTKNEYIVTTVVNAVQHGEYDATGIACDEYCMDGAVGCAAAAANGAHLFGGLNHMCHMNGTEIAAAGDDGWAGWAWLKTPFGELCPLSCHWCNPCDYDIGILNTDPSSGLTALQAAGQLCQLGVVQYLKAEFTFMCKYGGNDDACKALSMDDHTSGCNPTPSPVTQCASTESTRDKVLLTLFIILFILLLCALCYCWLNQTNVSRPKAPLLSTNAAPNNNREGKYDVLQDTADERGAFVAGAGRD